MKTLDLRTDEICEIVNLVERCVIGRTLPIEIIVDKPEALKKVIYALEEHDFRFKVGSNCVMVLE